MDVLTGLIAAATDARVAAAVVVANSGTPAGTLFMAATCDFTYLWWRD
jgi:hypothetical protein